MSLLSMFRRAELAEADVHDRIEVLEAELAGYAATNEHLTESLASLELAIDEAGWERLNFDGSGRDFTRTALARLIALARLNALKNPLIKRGVAIKAHYVWGSGVEVQARDTNANQIVQTFLTNGANADVLFGAQARHAKDRALTVDGQVMLALVPNPFTGQVNVRSLDIAEFTEILVDPDDPARPMFYLRRWTEQRWSSHGADTTTSHEAWFPDWRNTPPAAQRLTHVRGLPVRWDTSIYHVRVGGLDGMRWGVPEVYAALDWAKAYKLFLEDWATIVRSLSKFAWKATAKKNPAGVAAKLGGAPGTSPTPGSVFTGVEGVDLTPMPKSGATVASEDGVWLAKMVGAALDIPYTLLMGDPDMGNLATAKTLDRPTELAMQERQQIWTQVWRDLAGYAIDWAARAPGGPLPAPGLQVVNGVETVVHTDPDLRTVDVVFPPILERDVLAEVQAIVAAAGTDLPPADVVLRLLLTALGVEDVDEIMEAFDVDEWEQRRASAGQAALDAFRRGEDPAAVVNGGQGEDVR